MSSTRTKKFLDPEILGVAAETVLAIAREERVPIAFAGGFVMQLYDSPRLTGDVDIVATMPLEALPRGKPLNFGGYRSTIADAPVDVIIRDDEWKPLYDDALVNFIVKDGLPIIAPEFIVAMKMVAGRGKDTDDVVFLIATDAVDMTKVKRIVKEHLGPYALRDLDEFIREAQWRKEKGEF